MQFISDGETLTKKLISLLNKYNDIQFAVAWATCNNNVYKEILKHRAKVSRSVIGINSYVTEPQALVDYTNSQKVKFIIKKTGIFHPKIYIFSTGEKWEILIGSANMTNGGLSRNTELMLHISSNDCSRPIFKDACNQIDGYYDEGKSITKNVAEKYCNLYKLNNSKLTKMMESTSDNSKPPIDTDIMPMSWSEFFRKVKHDPHHGFNERCDLLSVIQDAFNEVDEYSEMKIGKRKMVAGLPTDYHDHWGWFGSMKGAGYFHQAINTNNAHLSAALDFIPKSAKVSRTQYLNYISEYRKAFPNGRDGIATATRLLAMKRPDIFVCLDGANKKQLCKDFGVAKSSLTYEKYWDEIITRIMDSVWWNEEMPIEKLQQKVWRARAAMLDAIYYEPT